MVDKIEIQKIYFPSSTSLKVAKLKDKDSQNNNKESNRQCDDEDKKEEEKDKPMPHRSPDITDNYSNDSEDGRGITENSNEEENKTQGKLIDIVI